MDIIADNKIAANAEWDTNILSIEFEHLCKIDTEGFDIEDTGFEVAEIDLIMDAPQENDPADVIPDVAAAPAITQPGDVWIMEKHRLICGDALQPKTYRILLGEIKVDMVFTDPPYNVPIDGHVCCTR